MRKIFKIAAIILAFLMPLGIAVAIELEQDYPEVPGQPSITQIITATTTAPAFIKYLATWAIIISILAVAVTLLIGGVQHIIATGDPGKMNAAKNRIKNSAIGLLILVGAYVVLLIVNPQLTIFTLNKVPVQTGIVLFTEDGYSGFSQNENQFEPLVKEGEIYFLNYNIDDLQKAKLPSGKDFGMSTEESVGSGNWNFPNFPLFALGFWGTTGQNSKVFAFPEINFSSSFIPPVPPLEYDFSGRIDPAAPKPQSEPEDVNGMKIMKIKDNNDFFKSSNPSPPPNDIFKPPLSIKITRTGPGIYLYSATGEERYFTNSEPDFNRSTVDFDQKANKIKIVNEAKTGTEGKHNYLVVIHQGDFFSGLMRLFFANSTADANDDIPKYNEKGIPQEDPPNSRTFVYFTQDPYPLVGNLIAEYKKIPGEPDLIQEPDQYGDVESVSSLNVFELDKESDCQEVKICTEKSGQGFCLIYSRKGETAQNPNDAGFVKYPMPYYIPVNIPTEEIEVVKETGKPELESVKFQDNIRSIEIKGKCLVALFEQKMTYYELGQPNEGQFKQWEGGFGPGTHSETFVGPTGAGELNVYKDLTRYQIGKCGSANIFQWFSAPCASAIGVFPIK